VAAGDDEPIAASYLTLRRGTEVFDRFDAHVGRVKRVLTEAGDFFDGLIIETDAGARFVDAPEVARITPARVELSIARSDVECPGPRGVYGVPPARWGRKDVTDDDRVEVVEALKAAYCADMLEADELGERVEAAYTVGTLDELERLLPE
jgi:DUF1707 SHOCT-like domain